MKRQPSGRARWNEVAAAVSARHAGVTLGTMFGMPCLKRPNASVGPDQ